MNFKDNLLKKTDLNDEQLSGIERMAAAAFTPKEIEEVFEIEHLSIVINAEGNPAHRSFRKGYLTRQLELRERIFQDAKNGSSPAQTLAYKLLEDVVIKSRL